MNTNSSLQQVSGTSALTSQALSGMSLSMQRQTRRELERVQARGLVAKLTEDGRAMLALTALEHASALAALEEHCIRVAPLGEARYREILDSYALGASAAIGRWGR